MKNENVIWMPAELAAILLLSSDSLMIADERAPNEQLRWSNESQARWELLNARSRREVLQMKADKFSRNSDRVVRVEVELWGECWEERWGKRWTESGLDGSKHIRVWKDPEIWKNMKSCANTIAIHTNDRTSKLTQKSGPKSTGLPTIKALAFPTMPRVRRFKNS